MISNLARHEANEILARGKMGHLGCIVENSPYVVPINYLFDGESIYIHSLPGRKITALRANPRACLQVEEVENEFKWQSVIAMGSYQEIEDEDERDRVLQRILDRFPHFTPVESAMAQVDGIPQTVIFRIKVDTVTGVAEG